MNLKLNTGIQFYINIINLDDITEIEEKATGEVKHTIHALDSFFTAIESYGKKHYKDSFVVEKITGSRLHMYVVNNNIEASFDAVSAVSQYAYKLTRYLNDNVAKYKTLQPFQIQVGACYGNFYEFYFKRINMEEMTTIGYVANYAAKLQNLSLPMNICISENLYEAIDIEQKKSFTCVQSGRIKKYNQNCYYATTLSQLTSKYNFQKDLERAGIIASQVDLQEMNFRDAIQPISYTNLSKTECKKLIGIPLFADVRGFTPQFDKDDINLEEMTLKTQQILTTMFEIVEKCKGIHVQFQGDREMAIFHDYSNYSCISDAVVAGLRIIDGVKPFQVCVGVGQSYGRLFAAKIGARNEKDNILIGRTVTEADQNEDKKANGNQLVISEQIYKKLRKENSGLVELFQKIDEQSYYTELGYSEFVKKQSQHQLENENKHKNYNGAWKEMTF